MRRIIALAVTTCAVVSASGSVAQAEPRDVSSEKLRKTVTLEGLQQHMEAFQAIGSANGNTRATGTPGYEASVEYVIATLEKAGYRVTTPQFNYPVWRENTPARLTWGTRTFTSSPSSASGTAVDMITFGFAQSGTLSNLLVVPTNDIVIHSGASGVMSSSHFWEANSAVQTTSDSNPSQSADLARWRWMNWLRCSSADSGNSSSLAFMSGLALLNSAMPSLRSPDVSLPVQ